MVLLLAGCSGGGGGSGTSSTGEGGVTWQQSHLIVDAEYDRAHDLIVTVSDAPYRLYVLDPSTRASRSVALNLAPLCVSVRPDGRYAAVGHSGFISYVDLSSMSVERVYSVTCQPADIVLPSNGWVYVTPVPRGRWDYMRCVNLSTGAETQQTGGSITEGSRIKLHPSGDYIYAADWAISPSDFQKFDIRSGTARYMYDSAYHGDFDFAYDLWMSDDGLRVLARSGNAFRTSEVQAQDLIFNGRLSDNARVEWADIASATNHLFVVPQPTDYDEPVPGEVHVYSYDFLTLEDVVDLPGFAVPDGSGGTTEVGAQGAYVFADSSGTAFHALYRARPEAGMVFDWAVATYDLGSGFRFGEPVVPTLTVSNQTLEFQCASDALNVALSNIGTSALHWEAAVDDPRIVLSTQSGDILPGGATAMTVSINWGAGGATPADGTITLTTDADQVETIHVDLLDSSACSNLQWRQDHNVVDAEYDKNRDVIVTVSADPSRLHVLDPNHRTRESVDLALPPHCVSVRPDGMYAAVGHVGFISYVNLITMEVERTYNVTCDVSDIVLASNGFIYSVPQQHFRWDQMRCTNVATGAETLQTSGLLTEGTRIKLHPSGDYLYGADVGISPSDFEKWDIRGGTAVYLYDSLYHGDYDFGGDIWISDDGLRLFARSGNVFRSGATRDQDMLFNGRLSDNIGVQSADTATADGLVYAVPIPPYSGPPVPGSVHVYSYDYLVLNQVVELPLFTVPDGLGGTTDVAAEGRYVFADSSGTKFHALYRAASGAGLLNNWAVATYDMQSGFQTGEPSSPTLTVSESDLVFQCGTDSDEIVLGNVGTADVQWTAAIGDPRVSLSETSGTIAPGGSVNLVASIDWSAGPASSDATEIVFTTGTNEVKTVTVRAIGEGACADQQWRLDHLVVDAEYDRNNDVIVTVATNPNRLYVLNPVTQTSSSVDLPLAPACVSVRPDGQYAAVGHVGFVSYVNLATMTLERTYNVTCDVFDVVLPSNGWVYSMPRRDQWERIRCIRLSDGVETLHTGNFVREGTKMRLHPSGKYIYGANNGLSPSDIEKYNIQSGTAQYLYDSPYHGDFAFNGDLWISDDGLQIFARSGNVFRSSEVQAGDMIFYGALSNGASIHFADIASGTGNVYVVPGPTYYADPVPGRVYVYSNDYLVLRSPYYDLPGYTVPDGMGGERTFPAEGAFVFSDSTGTKFHALYHSVPGSGVLLDWSVTSYEVGP